MKQLNGVLNFINKYFNVWFRVVTIKVFKKVVLHI